MSRLSVVRAVVAVAVAIVLGTTTAWALTAEQEAKLTASDAATNDRFGRVALSPSLINYQGVLRDNNGNPENGSFNMIFNFYDADGGPTCTGGTLLFTDKHQSCCAGAVEVTGGLFNVQFGGGNLTAGSENSVINAFSNNSEVYVEVIVAGEVLCPRVRVLSAAYSLNDARPDPPCFDASNRFVDCLNGTVTDTVTGFIWLKDADCSALGGIRCGLPP